ncbi:hypothetical protein BDZ45DRAFT_740255 [Acephala macrosclerotiorum]|nr:hypothetical protein BDZ45DRAFT_740255 [Acephala macrosclerotiorum]
MVKIDCLDMRSSSSDWNAGGVAVWSRRRILVMRSKKMGWENIFLLEKATVARLSLADVRGCCLLRVRIDYRYQPQLPKHRPNCGANAVSSRLKPIRDKEYVYQACHLLRNSSIVKLCVSNINRLSSSGWAYVASYASLGCLPSAIPFLGCNMRLPADGSDWCSHEQIIWQEGIKRPNLNIQFGILS